MVPVQYSPSIRHFRVLLSAQVEFCIKGELLYEEHAISNLRKRYRHVYWNIEFDELRQEGDGCRSTPAWVAILTPSQDSTQAVRLDILPRQGSPATLRWLPLEDSKGRAKYWYGLLLKSEIGFNKNGFGSPS